MSDTRRAGLKLLFSDCAFFSSVLKLYRHCLSKLYDKIQQSAGRRYRSNKMRWRRSYLWLPHASRVRTQLQIGWTAYESSNRIARRMLLVYLSWRGDKIKSSWDSLLASLEAPLFSPEHVGRLGKKIVQNRL